MQRTKLWPTRAEFFDSRLNGVVFQRRPCVKRAGLQRIIRRVYLTQRVSRYPTQGDPPWH